MPERKHYFMLKVIHKIKKQKVFKFVPVASGLTLVGVLGSASAAYATNTATLNLTANVAEPGLELSLSSNNITLNLAAPYTGTSFDSSAVTATVSAHNGYQLFMYGDTSLTNTSNNNLKINTVSSTDCSSGCVASSFTTNAWGYAVTHGSSDTPSFLPMTTGYNLLDSSNTSTNGQTIVNFGAKVDYTQTPGIYNNTLNFVAVANVADIVMQSATAADCGSDTPTLMKDSRDNTYYLTQRLADGKCWMLDNLALDPSDATTLSNITTANTNANATAINAFKNGSSTAGYATAKVNNDAWTSSSQNYTVPRTLSSGTFSDTPYDKNSTIDSTFKGGTTVNGKKIGVYYNYCAASAGSYCYNSIATPSPTPAQGDVVVTNDLCPSGWRLPKGGKNAAGTESEFVALYTAYGGTIGSTAFNSSLVTALQTPLSGRFGNGTTYGQGTDGYWWSSSFNSSSVMYSLNVDKSGVSPAGVGGRFNGLSIRCIINS